MSMTLTKDDLQALASTVSRVFDEKSESILQQAAAGFQEVHHKIDDLRVVVDRIDHRLQTEVARNDHQDADIKQIRKALHTA